MIGEVVEQKGDRVMHFGGFDGVIVVKHQDPVLTRRVFTGSGDVVDERGQDGRNRGGGDGFEDARVQVESNVAKGRHEVGQEARQVIVAVIEGKPAHLWMCLALFKVGEPVAEHGGLPEPGRCGHEGQPVAGIEGGVELRGKPGARDEF